MSKFVAKRLSAGHYFYRGYRINRVRLLSSGTKGDLGSG